MNRIRMRTVFVPFASVALTGAIARAGLDPTFGEAGIAILPQVERAVAAMLLPDGGIVVAGTRPEEFVLVRLHGDGSIDTSFGTAGVAAVHVGPSARIAGAVQQPDGRMVVAGPVENGMAIRFNPDGGVDQTFGLDGVALGDRPDCWANAVRGQPDGRLVIAGGCGSDLAVIRVGDDGMLDQSYGSGGVARVPGPGAADIVIHSDGAVIAMGPAPGDGTIRLVRFRSDGTIDPAFGLSGGITDVALDGWAATAALAQRRDCRLVVIGTAGYYEPTLKGYFPAFATVSFTPEGMIDSKLDYDVFPVGLPMSWASAVVADGNGLVVAGRVNFNADNQFALVRLGGNGLRDEFFGKNMTDVPGGDDDEPTSVITQPDGKFVVTGTSGARGVVARFNGSGASTTAATLPCISASTTTTTLPCATARCVLDAALGSAACASERVPRRITKKLGRAESLIDRAAGGAGPIAKLRRKATKLLSAAGRAARKAARGTHPKLAPACARAIAGATDHVAGDL